MKAFLFILFFLLFHDISHADSWTFAKERQVKEYRFADARIVRIIDATENQQYPDFIVEIYHQEKLMAKYRGISFETLAVDKTNNTFVGLSNSGLPGTAVVVFLADGTLTQLLFHGQFVPEYCQQSMTLSKLWFDQNNPDIQFKYDRTESGYQYITEISFRNCKGKRVFLADEVVDGFERMVKAYRKINHPENK